MREAARRRETKAYRVREDFRLPSDAIARRNYSYEGAF
jgi:hypothetical protein